MPEYLSTAWFDAADRALRADPGLAAAAVGVHLVLQQTVEDPPAVTWHIRIDDGTVSLLAGAADEPTVTFVCDRATADDVHLGRTSAQAAFIAGRLRVGGDIGALMSHQELLVGLGDVLGPLRESA